MPILILAMAVVVIDQWSKYYVQTHMSLGMSIPLIPSVFHLTYILNPGAAFGILENQRTFFVIVGLLMIGAVVYLYPRIPANMRLLRLGTGLMMGGAVGNVIDRIQTGHVVDFFDFRIWPIFNIADIAIVVGVSCIIYTLLFIAEKKDETN
ncbi:signal peptidase II [Anaerospora hongkongensis]|uniref:Lipoprotein signal peptidase n=1 Tax=Anaerospora hongkongensis TaxID=244830 RepID=A0A4R1QCN1_9FIRM|nr:signal peptidase II [Anaerospora hongkongensis]TCL40241.1 signal peptidase II [Anaerospora hongkongensis]